MGMFDDLLPASDGTMPEPKASAGMFDDLLPPAEEQRSTMADVGVGMVAAPVTVVQGITELGALALDAAFDTDYSKSVTAGFDEFKKEYGLRPQTTAGKMSEDVMAFGVGFIPFVAWAGVDRRAWRGSDRSQEQIPCKRRKVWSQRSREEAAQQPPKTLRRNHCWVWCL